MESTVNEILEKFDSFSIEDQESILEIEKKRLIQKKREILIDEVNQAQKEIHEGKYISGDIDSLMKAIEDESKYEICFADLNPRPGTEVIGFPLKSCGNDRS
jgi:hypothetical protein